MALAKVEPDLEGICKIETIESPINSDRYEIIHPEYPLGRGTWGVVYKGRHNVTGENVAIKVLEPTEVAQEQLKQRGLDVYSAMAKEAVDLTQAKGIVPRKLEFDSQDVPFLVMPIYDEFLDQTFQKWEEDKRRFGVSGYSLESKIKILGDIAEGLGSLHKGISGRVHGDLKPDNVAVDCGTAYVNDLGTSTIKFAEGNQPSRGERGFEKTRAPENFSAFVEPSSRSDVYSWGALAYKIFTGEYPVDTSANLSSKGIKDKIKEHVPKSFRKPILKALEKNPDRRQYHGNELVEEWSEATDDYKNHTSFKRFLKKSLVAAGIAAIAGVGFMGGKLIDRLPKKERVIVPVELGRDISYKGMIFRPGEIKDGLLPVDISYESLENPKEIPLLFNMNAVKHGMIRRSTDDPAVAYLTKCAEEAAAVMGGRPDSKLSPSQHEIYKSIHRKRDEIRYEQGWEDIIENQVNPITLAFARSIEPVYQRMAEDGKVDLEDLMVATRLGEGVLNKAKTFSGSSDYNSYKTSKDEFGQDIIPEGERDFINTWLSAYHQDEN